MASSSGDRDEEIRSSYFGLVEASSHPRAVVARGGRLLAASRGLLAMTGVTRDDALALGFAELLSPASAEEASSMLEAGFVAPRSFVFEGELRRAGGGATPMLMTATPLAVQHGTGRSTGLEGFLVKMQELESSRSYREALRARETAERASAEKARLLAQISHEVRTPMNIIMGYIQLARGGAVGEAEKRHLDTALSAAETLMNQMSDMLDLSKIEAGRLRLNIVAFDLGAEMRRVAKMMQARIEARGLEFHLEVDPDIPARMTGDPVRAMQVVQNFLTNAVKFTAAGSITLRARLLEGSHHGWRVRLEVQDTGRGVPKADQESIFRAFDRAGEENSGTVEGWGLGLSICRAIAELLGGEVGVESAPGEGATFHFDVAFGRPETEAMAEMDAPAVIEAPGAAVAARRRLSLLVAEDNQRNRFMIGEALNRLGHDVAFASDGLEAVAACDARKFDAVLMDIRMPRLCGDEATRRIRRKGANRDTPILAVTANSRDDTGARFDDAGFDRIMTKPIDLGALGALLDRVESLRAVG